MTRMTWRRVHAVHVVRAFGRRYRRCSRLLGMLLAALTIQPWLAQGALAQTTVAAGDTETGATIGGTENVLGKTINDSVTLGGSQNVLSGGVCSGTQLISEKITS